ncbi:MAG: PP2C family protein-serine/threonine phosphatase [Lachnospiraceae bacterium]|nr:PP2C family protein-serine/threonine phosphatase [Lachnospiraceae bacterium]
MKTGSKRLAGQFISFFVAIALVTILASALVTYINQSDSYHRECVRNLKELTTHLTNEAVSEGREFIILRDYFEKHKDRVHVAADFRGDYERAKEAFYSYVEENYPSKSFGRDLFFEDLDETAQELYVNWRFEHWFIMFFDAADDFNLSYVYFIYPDEDSDHKMVYMFDPTLYEEEAENGSRVLILGDTVYEDPGEHRNMWEAWETGEAPDGFDSLDNQYGYVYTYCMPLITEGEKVGLVCAEISVDLVNNTIMLSVIRQIIVSVVILAAAMILLYFFVQDRVLNRIFKLDTDIREYTDKKEPGIADVIRKHSGTADELGALSGQFADMIDDLDQHMKNLQNVTAEKERISTELNVATRIQESMLPRIFPPFPERKDMDLFAIMDPAKEVGGDFYDFFMLDENRIVLVMADVSGKGVPAALFMVIAKTLIKNRMIAGESVEKALSAVNNQLGENNDEMLFVTAWACVIDMTNGHAEYSDAGHETAYVKHLDGSVVPIKPAKKYPPLAALDDIEYVKEEFDLGVGDILFLYTDGVPEATNTEEEMYGTGRLEAFLGGDKSASMKDLLEGMHKDVDLFVGEADQFDDLTILGFCRKS